MLTQNIALEYEIKQNRFAKITINIFISENKKYFLGTQGEAKRAIGVRAIFTFVYLD